LPTHRLLVVEDEAHLAAGLKLNLELEGYTVDLASTAREAGERLLKASTYDAIVLDVMLPDLNGFDLCKKIRSSGNYTPVIMLTARSAAEDRVAGLEAGADDYLVKPFELEELLARVRSLLRRRQWERTEEAPAARPSRVTFGKTSVDFETHEAAYAGESVALTRLELDLLRYFVENPGRVLTRDELLEQVWKLRNYSTARTVDNFISRLRKHFEEDPSQPRHFLSVRGTGYKFVP
jgi:DNA-binding response OmpR family regulator